MSAAAETMVKVYKSPDDYRHDAAKLANQGWRVVSTSEREKRRSCLWLILFFPMLLWKPKPEIVVTYSRTIGVDQSQVDDQSVRCPRCGGPVQGPLQFCSSCGLTRRNPRR